MKRAFPLIAIFFALTLGSVNAQLNKDTNRFVIPRLSPLPSAVPGISNVRISLNGTWGFNPKGGVDNLQRIEVPGEWEMQGYKVEMGVAASYVKDFTMPKEWSGKKVYIRFDGISSYAKVYLNGISIGEHEGSFVPFELDLTNAAKEGHNQLKVMVESQTISDKLGCTSQYAAHPVGGILRKVTLFVLPSTNIADFSYTTTFDKSFKIGRLNVRGKVDVADSKRVEIRLLLSELSGKPVALKNGVIAVSRDGSFTGQAYLSSPKKWDAEHPNLYELLTHLVVDGKVLQTNRQQIGFRQIDLRGNQMFVNNMPIKLRGVNRHEVHPLRGRSLTPELNRRDVELFRRGNCNYIRTSHYPPSEEFLKACDELGMFVESESSLCWIKHDASPIWKEWNYLDAKFLPYMLEANYGNVLAGRQHPSVIIWSLGNESRWSPLWERVNKKVKELDPSRPTAFHDQCWGSYNNMGSKADIANYHYPGLNGPAESEKSENRPTIFGEYVHTQVYARRELVTDPAVKSDLYALNLKQMVDSVYRYDACLGGAIWSGIDDIFHLSNDKIVGYGPWGVIDGWRREKPEFVGMKNAYSPVAIRNASTVQPVNGIVGLEVQNRYDFTSFNELRIAATLNGAVSLIKSDIKPHNFGVIEIPVARYSSGDILQIDFTDANGINVQTLNVVLGEKRVKEPQLRAFPLLVDEAYSYLVKQEDIQIRILKSSGQIVSVKSGDKDLLIRGGAMMIVPVNGDYGGAPHVAGNHYTQDIQPLDYFTSTGWTMKSVEVKRNSVDSIVVEVKGAYDAFDGVQTYTFSNRGILNISYSYELLKDYSKDSLIRQFGMYFELPRSFDLLSWDRKGLWTSYPSYDIARLQGSAKANPRNLKYVEAAREIPDGNFADDANRLGSNDFRSTKSGIYFASLEDEAGSGICIFGNGLQHARSWVNGDVISFLIASVNGDGSCTFSSGKKLKFVKGSRLSGSFQMAFK